MLPFGLMSGQQDRNTDLLMRLDVQLQVGRQPALQVRPDSVFDVVIQPRLVDVDDQRVRVEGVVEVVDEDRQTPDLLAHGLAHLVLDVFRDRPKSEDTNLSKALQRPRVVPPAEMGASSAQGGAIVLVRD